MVCCSLLPLFPYVPRTWSVSVLCAFDRRGDLELQCFDEVQFVRNLPWSNTRSVWHVASPTNTKTKLPRSLVADRCAVDRLGDLVCCCFDQVTWLATTLRRIREAIGGSSLRQTEKPNCQGLSSLNGARPKLLGRVSVRYTCKSCGMVTSFPLRSRRR